MVSKSRLVLGFLLVAVVLISSEVAARELAENAEVEANDPVNDAKQYGGRYHYPPRGYPPGHGYGCRCCGHYGCRCCHYEGEVPEMKAEAEPHN